MANTGKPWMLIPGDDRLIPAKTEDLILLKGCGNSTSIYYLDKNSEMGYHKIIRGYNLKEYEFMESDDIIRIHQSHIVNFNFVDHFINPHTLVLKDPLSRELKISQQYYPKVMAKFHLL